MTFVADESVDRPIIERLRRDGHSVVAIAEYSPGVADAQVLELSTQRKAVLITADTDFGELVFRLGQATAGVLLVRLSGLSAEQKAEVVAAAVSAHGDELPRHGGGTKPGTSESSRPAPSGANGWCPPPPSRRRRAQGTASRPRKKAPSPYRLPWANLLARTFAVEILRCPCGGDRRVAERARILLAAHQAYPERFVLGVPAPPPPPTATWINKPANPEGSVNERA